MSSKFYKILNFIHKKVGLLSAVRGQDDRVPQTRLRSSLGSLQLAQREEDRKTAYGDQAEDGTACEAKDGRAQIGDAVDGDEGAAYAEAFGCEQQRHLEHF